MSSLLQRLPKRESENVTSFAVVHCSGMQDGVGQLAIKCLVAGFLGEVQLRELIARGENLDHGCALRKSGNHD